MPSGWPLRFLLLFPIFIPFFLSYTSFLSPLPLSFFLPPFSELTSPKKQNKTKQTNKEQKKNDQIQMIPIELKPFFFSFLFFSFLSGIDYHQKRDIFASSSSQIDIWDLER